MNTREFNRRIVVLGPLLRQRSLQWGVGQTESEDLVQETFLRLWQMRSSLTAHPNVQALALSVLRHLSIDRFRQRQREQTLLQQQPQEPFAEASADYERGLRVVQEIVDGLPSLQRQIFQMKEIEGYSASEIQLITGCTADSLRQNLSRARRRIREEYLRRTKE